MCWGLSCYHREDFTATSRCQNNDNNMHRHERASHSNLIPGEGQISDTEPNASLYLRGQGEKQQQQKKAEAIGDETTLSFSARPKNPSLLPFQERGTACNPGTRTKGSHRPICFMRTHQVRVTPRRTRDLRSTDSLQRRPSTKPSISLVKRLLH